MAGIILYTFFGLVNNKKTQFWDFFLIKIHSMQGWIASMRQGVARKRSTKRFNHTGNLFWKNLELKFVCKF